MRTSMIVAIAAVALVAAADVPAGWSPELFNSASTLQFYTVNSSGQRHWSTVWVVVIDGQPYLRLGSAATSRINGNVDSPYVKIRVGGNEFDRVIAQSAPEMKDKVWAAMADKYWLDIIVRYMDHPLTIRLVPATSASPAPGTPSRSAP